MEENNVSSVFDELAAEQPFFEYATTGQRFANFLLDYLVYLAFCYLVSFCIGIIMALTGHTIDEIRELSSQLLYRYGVALLSYFILYTLVEGISKGRSLGKLITGTQAVNYDLGAITWKQALIRTLSRMIPFEPFSMFNGVPWHDSISKTIVIKKRRQF